jgi:hypothetical protein
VSPALAEALVEGLGHSNPVVSDYAADRLRRFGRQAVPALVVGVRNGNPVVQRRAARLLKLMGASPSP